MMGSTYSYDGTRDQDTNEPKNLAWLNIFQTRWMLFYLLQNPERQMMKWGKGCFNLIDDPQLLA